MTIHTTQFCRFALHAALICVLANWLPAELQSAEPPQLVSARDPNVPPAAGGAGDSGQPVISPDGRYVLFVSAAPNLLPEGTNTVVPPRRSMGFNVYLRDRSEGTTTLLSADADGLAGPGGFAVPVALSTNGRYALFESDAPNLVKQDTNDLSDVFVRDVLHGVTLLVSANTNGSAGNGPSDSASMTPDGHYIVFTSAASDLVSNDTNNLQDVFIRDLATGTTTLLSDTLLSPASLFTRGDAHAPVISAAGRYVLYSQLYRQTVGAPGNLQDLYLRDLTTGLTVLASAGAREAVHSHLGTTNIAIANYLLSDDGQSVVYQAGPSSGLSQGKASILLRWDQPGSVTKVLHTNAVPLELADLGISMTPDAQKVAFVANAPGNEFVYSTVMLWDAGNEATTVVSAVLANCNCVPEESDAISPFIDRTGRYVAFLASSPGFVTNNLASGFHVYLRDLQTQSTTLVDIDPNGFGSGVDVSTFPQVSDGGAFVVFHAPDGTIVSQDSNGSYDVFLRNTTLRTTDLLSLALPRAQSLTPNQASSLSPGCISAEGPLVAFASSATDLVFGDTNAGSDVFLRGLAFQSNVLVSVNTNGVSGDGSSFEPSISADGRYVAFTSYATDLVPGITNQASNIYLRDLLEGHTTLVSVNSSGVSGGKRDSFSPQLSADGQFILFQSQAEDLIAGLPVQTATPIRLFVRDLRQGKTALLPPRQPSPLSMTPDGRYVAYAINRAYLSDPAVYVWDTSLGRVVYTNRFYNTYSSFESLAISPNGRLIASAGTLFSIKHVVLFDLTNSTNRSIAPLTLAGNSTPQFSANSRFLAYAASHGAGMLETNQVYLYDVESGQNLLISKASGSSLGGADDSDSPSISPDARFVAYRSFASDIVPGDTNGAADIFVYDRHAGTTMMLTLSRFGSFPASARSAEPMFSPDGQWLFFESSATDLVPNDYNNRSDIFAYRVAAWSEIPVFLARVTPSEEGIVLTWPTVAGKTYRVQFKAGLDSSEWQDATGEVVLGATQASFRDVPVASQRFYRVVAF